MSHKFKYLYSVITVLVLSGCGSTINLDTELPVENNESVLVKDDTVVEPTVFENQNIEVTLNEKLNNEVKFGIDELNRTIIDDFEKNKMLIDIECQDDLLNIEDKSISAYEYSLYDYKNLEKMREDAERVIGDLAMRLDNNPDESLSLAYEQEIARLKLEYKSARIKAWYNEIEKMKAESLEEIEQYSSSRFECDIRYAENEAERDRMLYVAKMSAEANEMYDAKLIKLDSQLREVEVEIDSVNNESFDGMLF